MDAINLFTFVNLALVVLSWRWAMQAFDHGQNGIGWINIIISAMNGAAVLSKIF
jgi:hypothetical protein